MNVSPTISAVMSTDIVSIAYDATVHEALDLMIANGLTCLPVLSSDQSCVGMVALPDLMQIASSSEHMLNDVGDDVFDRLWVVDAVRSQFGEEQIHAHMSNPPVQVDEAAPIGEAAELMLRHGIHHLPVIDASDNLKGVVSTMDLLKLIDGVGPTKPSLS